RESAGIPEHILYDHQETAIRIPMLPDIRSLNLANSVAIVLYEALRQQDFAQMQLAGELRDYTWR
ncbi:MAG: tRNA (uridine(34)/cytosine(34)/5-carboxymethylaminomethyluridine(34)-2'-O)-methyltransferase TrmL, partial [Lachnospiraceae bacterium]|nr:tRNA (uridine(34)/cytosine(34)/5-carboxymethylaminomethyluridine(34)-2'-O)-methyltransferase TrmL [Lachnospiraceae bacterium]